MTDIFYVFYYAVCIDCIIVVKAALLTK